MTTITRLLNDTAKVFRLENNSFDRYGNKINEWEQIESNIPVRIDEHTSTETDNNNSDTVVRKATLFSTYLGLNAYDEIEINNIRWKVLGTPQQRVGFSKVNHIEVQIETVVL